ncbi:MAG: YncE family protein [Myxococcales bacterium]|nr:YncE family protein [Myxococcales bacterium]
MNGTLKTSLLTLSTLTVVACGQSEDGGTPVEPPVVATRPSRSSSIALSEDGGTVAMVNPSDDSLSLFSTADNSRRAKVSTGDEPASVVIAPDGKTAYVANRGAATVSRIVELAGTPRLDVSVDVGAEPVALALSPTGARLFVAELAQGRVSVLDTATMQLLGSVPVDRPRALLVTNDNDADDADELLVVPQFYGVPVPGREAKDDGRTGRVRRFAVVDLADRGDITLAPMDSGFARGGVAGAPTVTTAPNQLAALATAGGRIFVTSVSASPEGPPRFDNNVFPVVYAADLATGQEVRGAAGTTNLARKIFDAIPSPSPSSPRFVPGDLADIDFVPGSNVSYVIGKGADLMVRVTWGDTVTIGSTQNKLIDLAGNDAIGKCQLPTGLVVDAKASRAYVNCGVTRRLGVVDLGAQALAATVLSAELPGTPDELARLRGLRFYFTGRGRWSSAGQNGAKGGEGWSSCGSCHPDGYSDNITWVFGTGPRQTTSQDGTFSHGPGAQKQRMMNWSGINDEHHDFERNVRGVSGGLGVITTAPTRSDCNKLDAELPVALTDNGVAIAELGKPLKELADNPGVALCGHKDWDDIDEFVKTIRPPRAVRSPDSAAVARGAALFVDGGCAKCHGGAGFTISRRFYQPAAATNALLAQTAFTPPAFFSPTTFYGNAGAPRTQISVQPAIAADDTGAAEAAPLGVPQAACSQRNVGTFGDRRNAAVTNALELRPAAGALVRAQGRAGYNVPSLYGLSLGAPYLHHGLSPTLEDLFTNPSWEFHTAAGAANFPLVLAQPGKLGDLISYLLTLDAAATELAIPSDAASGGSHDVCPQ